MTKDKDESLSPEEYEKFLGEFGDWLENYGKGGEMEATETEGTLKKCINCDREFIFIEKVREVCANCIGKGDFNQFGIPNRKFRRSKQGRINVKKKLV